MTLVPPSQHPVDLPAAGLPARLIRDGAVPPVEQTVPVVRSPQKEEEEEEGDVVDYVYEVHKEEDEDEDDKDVVEYVDLAAWQEDGERNGMKAESSMAASRETP